MDKQEPKTLEIRKGEQVLTIKLQKNMLKIRIKDTMRANLIAGSYTFDALPEQLKMLENIEEVFNYIKQLRNTDDLRSNANGLEITMTLTPKIKKIAFLPLEKIDSSKEEEQEFEIEKLKKERNQAFREKNEWKIKAFNFEAQLKIANEQIAQLRLQLIPKQPHIEEKQIYSQKKISHKNVAYINIEILIFIHYEHGLNLNQLCQGILKQNFFKNFKWKDVPLFDEFKKLIKLHCMIDEQIKDDLVMKINENQKVKHVFINIIE